ncbi:putative fatty acyl-CoA reductase CG5065 [Anabrus simplex]|uniref:putative fatty acyl-CoA reductase CG5065 n=1 Tax=Anabrus simplex TaxID=316456 RepID=UPI0035A27E94
MTDEVELSIVDFFKGRSLFITGGSGFMGKVLVEKLLYCCPDVKNIFLLLRPKRDKQPNARIEEMFKLPLFSRVRKEFPDAIKKIVVLHGDVTEDRLGLTPEQIQRLMKEVSVVFHFAATLRLEAKLKDAIQMNLTGTWRVLEMCKNMEQLKAFVHLSTAFCHCDQEDLEERMYPCPYEPQDLMRAIQWMDDTTLEMITPRLLKPHPNTYTFSKRLAEKLVESYYPTLPVTIARPSIVTPTWHDPFPGWVDNLNGPIGLLVAGGKGVLRSMHVKGDSYSEVIPVDMAINGIIRIAWKNGISKERPPEIPVYNVTASSVKRDTWAQILEKGRKYIYEYPFEMTVWYPDGNIRSTKFMHNVCVIFLHFLPAYFIDFLMFIFRQKRFMVRLQHRIQDGLEVLQYFTTRDWAFHSSKFMALFEHITPKDKVHFDVDFSSVDEEDYLKNCIIGARHYCMKEDPKSLPRCRRNMKILYVVDKVWSVLFYMFLLWLLVCCSDTARYCLDTASDYIKMMPVVRSIISHDAH